MIARNERANTDHRALDKAPCPLYSVGPRQYEVSRVAATANSTDRLGESQSIDQPILFSKLGDDPVEMRQITKGAGLSAGHLDRICCQETSSLNGQCNRGFG